MARAGHAYPVLERGVGGGVSAGAGVFGKAQVVIRAHVDDLLHHLARVPGEAETSQKHTEQ